MRRCLSTALYGGGSKLPATTAAPTSFSRLDALRAARQAIVVLTAFDAPTAAAARAAGADVILVGDSGGMVSLGYASTVPVTLDTMAHHCAAVSRGVPEGGPLLVGDLPFGSYGSADSAVASAARLVQEGAVHAVKLEGGRALAGRVRAVVEEGIPVMGHVGLLPQTALLGGGRYALAGRRAADALRLVEDALALQAAGARALVLEMVPWQVAGFVTALLRIPTIGIGAGPGCSGQVLVASDALGHTQRTPFFVKRYAELGQASRAALAQYAAEVRSGAFPSLAAGHAKGMDSAEVAQFHALAARHYSAEVAALQALQDTAQAAEDSAASAGSSGQAPRHAFTAAAAAAAQGSPAPPPPAPAPSPTPAPIFSTPAPPLAAPLQPLSIAILGSGAIGSLLACTLAASGYSPTIYSHWKERIRHINSRGIAWMDCAPGALAGGRGEGVHDAPPSSIRAVDAAAVGAGLPGSSAVYDVVFCAGSACDADTAFPLALSLLHPQGLLLPLYNGHFAHEYGASLCARAARPPWQLGAGLTSAGATLPSASSLVERTSREQTVHLFLPGLLECGSSDGGGSGSGRAQQRLQGLVQAVGARAGLPGAPPLSFALHAPAQWAPHRLTKLLVNSVLNPCMALASGLGGLGSSAGAAVNGDFSALTAGAFGAGAARRGPLADAAEGLCEEAAACLGDIEGYAGVAGWEGVRDKVDVLALVRAVSQGTYHNVNSMAADAVGGRASEVDFISGALVAHLAVPTWNNRMLAAVTARERAVGVRSSAHEARIKRVWGTALEVLNGRVFR